MHRDLLEPCRGDGRQLPWTQWCAGFDGHRTFRGILPTVANVRAGRWRDEYGDLLGRHSMDRRAQIRVLQRHDSVRIRWNRATRHDARSFALPERGILVRPRRHIGDDSQSGSRGGIRSADGIAIHRRVVEERRGPATDHVRGEHKTLRVREATLHCGQATGSVEDAREVLVDGDHGSPR